MKRIRTKSAKSKGLGLNRQNMKRFRTELAKSKGLGLNRQNMKRFRTESAKLKGLGLNRQKCNRFRTFLIIFPFGTYSAEQGFFLFFLSQALQKKRTITYAIVLLQGGNKYKIQENVCS